MLSTEAYSDPPLMWRVRVGMSHNSTQPSCAPSAQAALARAGHGGALSSDELLTLAAPRGRELGDQTLAAAPAVDAAARAPWCVALASTTSARAREAAHAWNEAAKAMGGAGNPLAAAKAHEAHAHWAKLVAAGDARAARRRLRRIVGADDRASKHVRHTARLARFDVSRECDAAATHRGGLSAFERRKMLFIKASFRRTVQWWRASGFRLAAAAWRVRISPRSHDAESNGRARGPDRPLLLLVFIDWFERVLDGRRPDGGTETTRGRGAAQPDGPEQFVRQADREARRGLRADALLVEVRPESGAAQEDARRARGAHVRRRARARARRRAAPLLAVVETSARRCDSGSGGDVP